MSSKKLSVGDLVKYYGADPDGDLDAVGLCLSEHRRKTHQPEDARAVVMKVLWFDDWQTTDETPELDEEDSYLEIISPGSSV